MILLKKKNIILLLIIVSILAITVTSLFYSFYKVDYVKEFNMSIIVGDHIGIDVSADELRFGMVPPGQGSATRNINVHNSKNYPLKVNVHKYGEIKDWVSVSPQNFIIKENEDKQVSFDAKPPSETEYGNYTGKIRFYFLKT